MTSPSTLHLQREKVPIELELTGTKNSSLTSFKKQDPEVEHKHIRQCNYAN